MIERFFLGKATGLSMWPTLRPGDTLIVDRTTRRVTTGDLVIFDDVVHRVIWVDPFERVWEHGDSASGMPRRRDKREIRGHVAAVVRDGVFIAVAPRRPSLTCYVKLAIAVTTRLTGKSYRSRLASFRYKS